MYAVWLGVKLISENSNSLPVLSKGTLTLDSSFRPVSERIIVAERVGGPFTSVELLRAVRVVLSKCVLLPAMDWRSVAFVNCCPFPAFIGSP